MSLRSSLQVDPQGRHIAGWTLPSRETGKGEAGRKDFLPNENTGPPSVVAIDVFLCGLTPGSHVMNSVMR